MFCNWAEKPMFIVISLWPILHWKFLLVGGVFVIFWVTGSPLDTKSYNMSAAFSVHRLSCYASQSSSSVVEWGAGSGGMTSDILANAPPVPAGTSPDSPPAGPLPDMPAVGTGHITCGLQIQTPEKIEFTSNMTEKSSLTFPSHGKFIEEIRHEVSAARCHSHCWEADRQLLNNQYFFLN